MIAGANELKMTPESIFVATTEKIFESKLKAIPVEIAIKSFFCRSLDL